MSWAKSSLQFYETGFLTGQKPRAYWMSLSSDFEKTGERQMLFLFCIPLHKYSHTHKKKRKPLYTCFIDFSKAFDKVHHGLLWEKLVSVGLCSKTLAILQNMYTQASSRIWLCKAWESETFACRRGIRQGCNISHLLPPYLTPIVGYWTNQGVKKMAKQRWFRKL